MPQELDSPLSPGLAAPDLAPAGSVAMDYTEAPVQELWRMVYDAPFTSQETQRIQQRFGSSAGMGGVAPPLDFPEPSQARVRGGQPGRPSEFRLRASNGITYGGEALDHPTSGLDGFPAVDLFAKPGTPFTAPEDGKVVRLSGKGGTNSHGGGAYGWSVYFLGKSGKLYYITHLNKQRAGKGSYKKGDVLGTISRADDVKPHAHVGVKG